MDFFMKLAKEQFEGLILFLGGVLISATFSALFDKTFSWSEASLIVATILLVLISTFYFREIYKRIQIWANLTSVKVEYVAEPYSNDDKFEGIVYYKLTELVNKAKKEILYFSVGRSKESAIEHHARTAYYDSFLQAISRNKKNDFQYVFIRQIPENSSAVTLTSVMNKHCQEVAKRRSDSIDVLKVKEHRLHSFLIVDQRDVAIYLYRVDADGATFTAAVLLLDDSGGNVVREFTRYFNEAQRKAQEVTLDELKLEAEKITSAFAKN